MITVPGNEARVQMSEYNKSLAGFEIPLRLKSLPISPKGWPVPWFVGWIKNGKPCKPGDGEPDFRTMDGDKFKLALRQHRCWVCGGLLGIHKAFTIGPMCAINRVISEPPSHRDCAIFSAQVCPFLSQPRMRRNEKDLPEETTGPAGFHLKRNPGAICVWITKSYRAFRPRHGGDGILFSLGHPLEVLWFAEGRKATRSEVMASINSGYPSLLEIAAQEGPSALEALERQRHIAVETLVPA